MSLLEEGLRIWEGTWGELYILLRMAQIQVVQGKCDEAQATLERVRHVDEQNIHYMGRVGLHLVSAILYNALGSRRTSDDVRGHQNVRTHLHKVLELAARTIQLVADTPLTRQYEMVAACESAAAHLALAECLTDETGRPTDAGRQHHLHQALQSSQAALDLYQSFGFVQPIECVSEEILYRHSLALAANGRQAEAADYLRGAYDEMMRKRGLIPPDSHYRRTYLENIPLHREIRASVVPPQSVNPRNPLFAEAPVGGDQIIVR
jgi:hypothetical protein